MIEKCSIGNMTNNIQNITLILLILILIIVIIYYLKNSNAKHNELIEKYTNTPIESSDASYITHYSANSQRNSNFPSTGTTVTLRDCQVQFNNTFTKDDNVTVDDNATVKYTYGDEWKEIDTLTEPGSSPIRIPEKIISRSNETNAADITNYSERTKCFRRMSSTDSDNKYRYAGNNLIQYRAGSASEQGFHSELKVGADGTAENYMEMKFNLAPSNSTNYYNNLTSSICSLQYTNNLGSDTGSGLGGLSLYRLTLDTNNKITAINQITINSTNNHIFTVSQTTSFADLLTSTSTISYVYSDGNFIYKNNSSLSSGTNNIGVKIYRFNRELLCSNVQKNIKSYQIFDNKEIDANKIVNVSKASFSGVINSTSFPNAASSYASKNAVKTAIERRIETDIATANTQAISDEKDANDDITTRTGERDAFLTDINTKEKYLDKIFDTTLDASKKDFLIKMGSLELDKLGYQTEDVSSSETILTSRQEPLFSNSQGGDIYTIETYTDTSKPYDRTFNTDTICDILIVGGGGSGDRQLGGGGGGGAVLYATNITIPTGSYTIKVGKGGENGNGGNSEAFGAICLGGGSTDFEAWNTANNGKAGGSGSGASPGAFGQPTATGGSVGTSTKGTLLNSGTLYNGNPGGKALPQISGAYHVGGGGGGGAGTAGFDSTQTVYSTRSSWIVAGKPSNGGDGIPINITGTTYYWGAGGGGVGHFGSHPGDGGLGGGGGGSGSGDSIAGLAGTGGINSGSDGVNTGTESGGNGGAGTGSGGGGGGYNGGNSTYNGGNGGSGIVIIRYRNVPEQIENEKQITLTWDSNQFNKLVYDFSPYNELTSWKQYAKNNGFNYQFTHWNANRIWEYSSEGVPKARHITSRGFIELKLNNDYDYVIVEFSIPDATNIGVVNETAYVNLFMYDNGSHKESEWNDKYNSENSTQIKGTWWHRDYKDQPLKFESAYTKDQSIRIVEYESSISKNIKITLLKRIIIYNVVLPVNTIVFLNGNKATLNTGTYDIIMGPLGCEIRNRVTKNLIGNYEYRYGNKLEFKYPITKTLQQLHDNSTSFSGTIYTIGMSEQKYSLGNKASGTIKKYRVYIYKRLLNHTIELYSNNTLLKDGTDYITGNDEDAVPKTINLRNLYITINKNIAGIIYLKSDKPIFFISETNRTSFNNTTDAIFGTNVNKLKASGSGTLSSLNDIFGVSEANTALTTAQNKKITYNINTILESPLTISYNSSTISTINPAGKNSLDNLKTTYNNIHRYNESSGGALTEKINEHTFGNILNPAETDIEKYISYEYPTAPTDDKLTPSTRNTPFNIRSNATKYVYFRKSS